MKRRLTMMKRIAGGFLTAGLAVAVMGVARAAAGGLPMFPVRRCAPDGVLAGTTCLDRYEASVWRVPQATTTNVPLVRKIQFGRATQADLTAGGATQLGTAGDDYEPCTDTGESCADDIYAVSLSSQVPSAFLTWFQAQEACANAGKRLPTSAEWQVGAYGTPDPGPDDGATDCNSDTGSVSLTGARSSCVSARGAFDMVGNLDEWVADWVPLSTECSDWGGVSDDLMCLLGASTTARGPGALLRGGDFRSGSSAGPLAVVASGAPSNSRLFIGFRCAR
jgi:formylglycine-generating enzyme required for sulfatase activity